MSRQKTVLVTGATGTVGRRVVSCLEHSGVQVRAMSRDPDPLGTTAIRGDLTDPDSVRAAVSGVDAVFLLWPFATAEKLPAVLDAIAGHARRVVYLSSAAERAGERHAEQLIEQSGLEWTFLRPHAFSANTFAWSDQIRSGGVVRGPYPAAATAPIDEHDIAAVASSALTSEGHTGVAYLLTGPQLLTQEQQARIIGDAIGRQVRWIDTPARDARRDMLARGWPAAVVDDILRAQADLVTTPGPVTDAVREVTGAPARTFRQWAEANADRFRDTARLSSI
ncbi:NAD(P)H-binding protein [Nocardia sp. NPDC057668]|uniref:NAD(P)H-binding protein n=1 Tax=Nocardia sp. NPDC057668 TaxID=3346202 RepID=UPI0036721966